MNGDVGLVELIELHGGGATDVELVDLSSNGGESDSSLSFTNPNPAKLHGESGGEPIDACDNSDEDETVSSSSSEASISVESKGEKMKKLLIFISLWAVYLNINASYSIVSPFYPQEAAKYNIGSLGVGLIEAASPLCELILSPILGYYIPEIGLNFMLISGCFLAGGTSVIFGVLTTLSSDLDFFIFSVLLRVVEGIGSAGYSTSLFTIATVLYPKSTGTVTGILEVASGLGFVIGPPLGGLLYQVGGFALPFVVTGGLVLLFVPAFMMLLPDARGEKQFIPLKTLLKLHTDIPFLLLGLDFVIMIAALEFFSPTLAPFLVEEFHLSEIGIGLVFLIDALTYMVSSLLAGKLSDLVGQRYLIVIGFLIMGVSYFFIGPAEFVSTESNLWLTCVAFGFEGIGLGFGLIPIYPDMLNIARRIDPTTSFEAMTGIVNGLCSSMICLGEFLGPIIGGALTTVLPFQTSTMIFGQVMIAKALVLLGVSLIDRLYQRTRKPTVCLRT